jgi:hypothetical protein
MQRRRGMGSPGHIDREKHEVDVAEHVLAGGVRAERADGSRTGAHAVAVDGGLRAWPLGLVASAVQVQVLDDDGEIIESSDQRPPADDPTLSSPAGREPRR